jgi:hypothetical protein
MENSAILIIANQDDYHANLVDSFLKDAKHSSCKLDFTQPLKSSISFNGSSCIFLSEEGEVFSLDSFKSVWWRRTGVPSRDLTNIGSDEVNDVERYWFLRFAIESLPTKVFPLGHPVVLRQLENKILQLQIGRRVGFNIPKTCISDKYGILFSFAQEHQWLVVKPLRVGACIDSDENSFALLSTPVKSEIFKMLLLEESLSWNSQLLFCQEKIPKVSRSR